MREHTQTNLDPGNCWQTAVACCLGVEPDEVPPQVELEEISSDLKGPLQGWGSYSNILNGYLKKHHNLVYSTLYRYHWSGVSRLVYPWHVLTGPTVRSQANKEQGKRHSNHAVVGYNGLMVWDVHPSRAGLLPDNEDMQWGIFAPYSPSEVEKVRDAAKKETDEAYRLVFSCLCPKCGSLGELLAMHRVRKRKEAREVVGESAR